jgi:hypothetical protein
MTCDIREGEDSPRKIAFFVFDKSRNFSFSQQNRGGPGLAKGVLIPPTFPRLRQYAGLFAPTLHRSKGNGPTVFIQYADESLQAEAAAGLVEQGDMLGHDQNFLTRRRRSLSPWPQHQSLYICTPPGENIVQIVA